MPTRSSGERGPGLGRVGVSVVPSRLSKRLDDGRHPDAERAFQLARRGFLQGDRMDMGALAAELGVDRTSLFRWVGNRDALLAEVLWSIAIPTIDQAEISATGLHGSERVIAIISRFTDWLISADYFREFLRREPTRALRLLTTSASPIHRRYVASIETLIGQELGDSPVDHFTAAELAYLVARITESFAYTDLITGEPPNLDRATAALRLILRVDRPIDQR